MKWLFLAAGAAALSFLLLMRLKRKNGRSGERGPFFEPAGRFLAERLPWSEKEKEKKARTLRELYGEKDLPEQLLRYRAKLFGHWLLLFVIGCFALFALGFCGKEESPISGDLPREEESGSISVEALIEGEEEPHSVTVDLPALEPTLEEKVQWLAEADDFIADYFEKLGPLSAAPDFPASWGHATFDYYSLDPLVLDDEARFFEGWPAEEYQAVFRVLVWVEDMKSSVDVTLYFVPAAELAISTQWQLLREQILAGAFTEEAQVRLPTETAGGLAVRWQLPSTKSDPGAGFLLLLLLLFLYKIFDEALLRSRAEREKNRAERACPELCSELLVLLNAGLSVPNAWIRCDGLHQKRKEKSNLLREQFHRTAQKLTNGFPTADCLNEFAAQTTVPQAGKMAELLVRSNRYGNERIVADLRRMNDEAWEREGRRARESAEKADVRLVIPLMLMLIVILVIVMAPAIMQIKGA